MVAQEDEIDKLEKERTQLLKRLRVKALERGERAAKKGMPVEQLAALEELAAELDTDPDFEGERVGAARLRVEAQQQAAVRTVSTSFANVTNVDVLRQRGSALQSELAEKGAALQEAEAGKRKLEREKASLLKDQERLEEVNATMRAQLAGEGGGDGISNTRVTGLQAQNKELLTSLQDARRAMQDVIVAVTHEPRAAPATRPLPSTNADLGSPESQAVPNDDQLSAIKDLLATAQDQLDARLVSIKDLIETPARGGLPPTVPMLSSVSHTGSDLQKPGTAVRNEQLGGLGEAAAGPETRVARRNRLQALERAGGARGGGENRTNSTNSELSGRNTSVLDGVEHVGGAAEGSVVIPEAFEAGAAQGDVDPYDLIAALNAQVIESMAMLAGQQAQLVKADRETQKYKNEMGDLHDQQTYLYACHVREVRTLQLQLKGSEKRALTAEQRHAEDAIKIESWYARGRCTLICLGPR